MSAACRPFGPSTTSNTTLCEDVWIAAVWSDEAEALFSVEPLDDSGCHILIWSFQTFLAGLVGELGCNLRTSQESGLEA
jgi:hypothetical protein